MCRGAAARAARLSAHPSRRWRDRLVRFHLSRRDLSMVTEAGDRIVANGAYTVSVGGGQPQTGAPSVSGTFQVTGRIQLPE